jgi:hypothetical protein
MLHFFETILKNHQNMFKVVKARKTQTSPFIGLPCLIAATYIMKHSVLVERLQEKGGKNVIKVLYMFFMTTKTSP